MPTNNIIANLFTTLFNTEDRRKNNCVVIPTSKLGMEVLKTLKNEGYIGDFEHIDDKRGGKFKIQLLAKITKCGAITPRFKVKKDEYNTWEQQFLPAYNRGILLVTTNQGVMSHKEASHKEAVNKNIGGFLIGYVY
jgi:small subunit ribosomal protein S8